MQSVGGMACMRPRLVYRGLANINACSGVGKIEFGGLAAGGELLHRRGFHAPELVEQAYPLALHDELEVLI